MARIALDVRAARAAVLSIEPRTVTGPSGIGPVTAAADRRLRHADSVAHRSPPLRVAAAVPGVRDQVLAIRDATTRGRQLGAIAARTGRDLQRQLDVGTGGSANRLALVEVLASSTDRAAKEAQALPPLPRRRLAMPPLRLARTAVAEQQDEATIKLQDAAVQAEALRGLLRGPRRILVLAATNAEMMSGGGLVGQVAIADVLDGAVKLGPFVQSSDIVLRKTGAVPLTPDQQSLWGTMGFGYDYRGMTSVADFQQVGPVAATMAEWIGFGKVDSVVMLDVLGLQRLVAVTGPVQVDDLTIDAENAADQLLYRNYLRFAAYGGPVREERAELQGRVGQGVFKALEERPTDLGRLFDALRYNVASRHLMGWSADPNEQLLWERAGAAGKLHTEGLQISLNNRGGNKLDYHLRPQVVVTSRGAPGGERRVRLEVTTANLPRDPTSPVIEGRVTKRHTSELVARLPQNAADIQIEGRLIHRGGEEGGMKVVLTQHYIDLGATVKVAIEFTIPKDQPIRLVPSARAHPIPFKVGDKTVTDEGPAILPL